MAEFILGTDYSYILQATMSMLYHILYNLAFYLQTVCFSPIQESAKCPLIQNTLCNLR